MPQSDGKQWWGLGWSALASKMPIPSSPKDKQNSRWHQLKRQLIFLSNNRSVPEANKVLNNLNFNERFWFAFKWCIFYCATLNSGNCSIVTIVLAIMLQLVACIANVTCLH